MDKCIQTSSHSKKDPNYSVGFTSSVSVRVCPYNDDQIKLQIVRTLSKFCFSAFHHTGLYVQKSISIKCRLQTADWV